MFLLKNGLKNSILLCIFTNLSIWFICGVNSEVIYDFSNGKSNIKTNLNNSKDLQAADTFNHITIEIDHEPSGAHSKPVRPEQPFQSRFDGTWGPVKFKGDGHVSWHHPGVGKISHNLNFNKENGHKKLDYSGYLGNKGVQKSLGYSWIGTAKNNLGVQHNNLGAGFGDRGHKSSWHYGAKGKADKTGLENNGFKWDFGINGNNADKAGYNNNDHGHKWHLGINKNNVDISELDDPGHKWNLGIKGNNVDISELGGHEHEWPFGTKVDAEKTQNLAKQQEDKKEVNSGHGKHGK